MRKSVRLVVLGAEWNPEPGSPLPVLWQTEQRAVLIYQKARSNRKALVEFTGCLITKFGYPNDEALSGHSLHAFGLEHYGAFEVLGSSWLEELNRQNRVAFPASDLSGFRHFVITLHDSTFECLAQGVELRQVEGPIAELLGPYLGDDG